ncbi:uncharacterized protein LOC131021693 [Salvia miltiorrhiza]|uniref:uncharacterized protein LOC131021693 n=1 Tax=Salvia miltiorrhiza TaxID=226208 RepID=UPI0025AC9493|nr:uncharacterized protein LOC131021693 [Salvia miltiorrhiza]
MAACGGIEHIFEKPLSEAPNFLEALSPWKHMKALNIDDDSSLTEMFGELHFKENHSNPCLSPSPASSLERDKGYYQRKRSSSDSLSLCTEGLGFESFDDVEETSSGLCHGDGDGDGERTAVARNQRSSAREAALQLQFPPPISCIGRSGKPWVCFKAYREDGRFILKEIRIPTQEFLHACRHDGRLQLRFVHSDDHQDVDDCN